MQVSISEVHQLSLRFSSNRPMALLPVNVTRL